MDLIVGIAAPEANAVLRRVAEEIVGGTRLFLVHHNRPTGKYDDDDDDDAKESDMGVHFVDAFLSSYLDGDALVQLARGYKPAADSVPLIARQKVQTLVDCLIEKVGSEFTHFGLDADAKARVYTVLELVAQRLLGRRPKTPCLDHLIAVVKSDDTWRSR